MNKTKYVQDGVLRDSDLCRRDSSSVRPKFTIVLSFETTIIIFTIETAMAFVTEYDVTTFTGFPLRKAQLVHCSCISLVPIGSRKC